MDRQPARLTLEGIDYASAFRFTRLFECFRIAIHPSRLGLALLLILSMYITGRVMDGLWGGQVVPEVRQADTPGSLFLSSLSRVPGEFDHYVRSSTPEFDRWYEAARQPEITPPQKLDGVFSASMRHMIQSFQSMVAAAIHLRPGFDQVLLGTPIDDTTVVGAIRKMAMIPAWLWHTHCGFFVVYLVLLLAAWALLGGAISRLAVVAAAGASPCSAAGAVRFASRRWPWFVASPIIPLAVVGVCWGVLAVGGLLFRIPVVNFLGGLLLVGGLVLGFVMAVLLIGWVAGVHLIYPALAAEGSDGFDAMSRAYSYVLARPWRLLMYSLVSLVYGAITYLFVGLCIFTTIFLTQRALATFMSGAAGREFAMIFPAPKFGDLSYAPDTTQMAWSAKITATLVMVWVHLLVGALGAYALSFYFSSYSTIYLLLRRHTDGTDTSDIYEEPPSERPHAAKDKLEPVPAAPPPPPGGAPLTLPATEVVAEEADNT